MTALPHSLERSVLIAARPETVFRFFTDSTRFAAWWGAGSRIDPTPGGEVYIRYPNGVVASGRIVEITPPTSLRFTYGYEAPGSSIPPGGSEVTITLKPEGRSTHLRLEHLFAEPRARDEHRAGWRYQLAVFSTVVSAEVMSRAEPIVDRYLAAWGERDLDRRRAVLGEVAEPEITFRDRFSATQGLDDLAEHIGAAQQHLPVSLERDGPVLACQGTATAGWLVRGPDGNPMLRGQNVYEFSPDGLLQRVVGLWPGT